MLKKLLSKFFAIYKRGMKDMGIMVLPMILIIGFGGSIWIISLGTIIADAGQGGLMLVFVGLMMPFMFGIGVKD